MSDLAALFTRAIQNQSSVPPDSPRPRPPTPDPPAGYRALLAATDGVVREIVELHGPKPYHVRTDGSVAWWECRGCEFSGYDGEPPVWPCETTELIADRSGVDLKEAVHVVDGETA
jgi:hypothetical protein